MSKLAAAISLRVAVMAAVREHHCRGLVTDDEFVFRMMAQVDNILLAYSDAAGSDRERSHKNCPGHPVYLPR